MATTYFKPINGYENKYLISCFGEVYSLRKRKYLKPLKTEKGYLAVELWDNYTRKVAKVHRLVAEAFIENPNKRTEVNHKDGNKENNDYTNLEWCTRSENLRHAYRTGLRQPNRKRGSA